MLRFMSHMLSSDDQVILHRILLFIDEIGLKVIECNLPENTFLPGLNLGPDCIYLDRAKLLYPGDLLHEAGHLAITEGTQRRKIGTADIDPTWPNGGEELGAILWSYAALKHIGIAPEVVFHEYGYKGEAKWLIDNFESENYVGLPFLEWTGIAYSPIRAEKEGVACFPYVLKWIRD